MGIKYYSEYYGTPKISDDSILGPRSMTVSFEARRRWRCDFPLSHWRFDEEGRIVDSLRILGKRVIKTKRERLFQTSAGVDSVELPKLRLLYEFREFEGKVGIFKVPTYKI